jgi:tetratricopeptide (TPR) repeat protein
MKELERLLARQDFKDENDLKTFLDSLMGKPLPEISFNDLTPLEQAEELVEEARRQRPPMALETINKALAICPDCIQAYEVLALVQKNQHKMLDFLEKGIEIGERLFEQEKAEFYAGHFWVIHETRPYMRCLAGKATLLYLMNRKPEGIAVQEKMLVLNPNDNQGIRDELSTRYVELGYYDKFTALYKQFNDGNYALMAFFAYNRVLCEFKVGGDTEAARESLAAALTVNKFVPKKLIAFATVRPPAYYGIGDENEASLYCIYAKSVWFSTKGAIEWLKKQTKK